MKIKTHFDAVLYLVKKKLIQLFETNKQNPLKKNKNLIKIISNLHFIESVYYRLKHRWANFPTKRKIKILNKIDVKILKRLSEKIKTGNYDWTNHKTVNHNFIFDFKDKIIEKLIEIVLRIIYKPNFQALVCNSTFNSQKRYHLIMDQLKAQKHEWTYGFKNKHSKNDWNLDSKIFQKILKKKISDFKFLKIIRSLLKTNVSLKNKMINFIFYNIYMHEFDLYFSKKIKDFNNKNTIKSSTAFKLSKKYVMKDSYNQEKKYPFSTEIFQKLKNYIKFNKRKQIKLEIQKKLSKNSKTIYHRFNNHFIIFVDYCLYYAKIIKKKLVGWFKKNLKINISKILLINLIRNKLNYLGFTIFIIPPRIKSIYYGNKMKARRKKDVVVFVGIDHKYLKSKLIKKKIITPKYKPNFINNYRNLKLLQIILKFKQKLKILLDYYYNTITYTHELNYYYYVYKFACLKTLTHKTKKSLSYISNTKFSESLEKKYIFSNYFSKNIRTNNSSLL